MNYREAEVKLSLVRAILAAKETDGLVKGQGTEGNLCKLSLSGGVLGRMR